MSIETKKNVLNDLIFDNVDSIKLSDGFGSISFNLSFYDLESVYSAAYSLMEKGYFFFGGSVSEVKVNVFPRENNNIQTLILELSNRVINYSFYKIKSVENKSIKEIILSRSLFTSDGAVPVQGSNNFSNHDVCSCETPSLNDKSNDNNANNHSKEVDFDELDLDDFEFEDLEDIKIPWEDRDDKEVFEKEREELKKSYDEEK